MHEALLIFKFEVVCWALGSPMLSSLGVWIIKVGWWSAIPFVSGDWYNLVFPHCKPSNICFLVYRRYLYVIHFVTEADVFWPGETIASTYLDKIQVRWATRQHHTREMPEPMRGLPTLNSVRCYPVPWCTLPECAQSKIKASTSYRQPVRLAKHEQRNTVALSCEIQHFLCFWLYHRPRSVRICGEVTSVSL